MNSIQRVKAAIHFKNPDRAPVYKAGLGDVFPMPMMPSKKWHAGHEEYEHGLFPFHNDDRWLKMGIFRWKKPEWAKAPEYKKWLKLRREEVDEFGVIWDREGKNASMGHPGRAILTDWADYDSYLEKYSPDPDDKTRYIDFIRIAKLVGARKYRMGQLGFQGPFTTAASIRGFTNFMMDHRRNPDELRKLLAHLTDFYIQSAKCWVKYGAKPHGFILYDDLGDQQRPFISPSLFEEFHKPAFKAIIDPCHDLGCELHLHSCGKIDPYIPMFIDWGLDALELDSPRMIGYADLEQFRGKIMMWGCLDLQKFYSKGCTVTPDECEQEVWRMIRNMGTSEGGYGAYLYPQPYHLMTPKENIKAFNRGLKKYGTYAKIPSQWWKMSAEEALPKI